jgi:hypothetical protein
VAFSAGGDRGSNPLDGSIRQELAAGVMGPLFFPFHHIRLAPVFLDDLRTL